MSLLISLLRESLSALLALEWLRLEMGAHMVDGVAELGEVATTLEAADALVGSPRLLIQHKDFLQVLGHSFNF